MAVDAENMPTVEVEGRPHRAEMWWWLFMRFSGLALLFLALAHFAITHIVNDVAETTADFVTNRWDNTLWRAYDWSLLALGLLHGVNGVRVITDDYVRNDARRKFTKAVTYLVTGGLFVYGTYTVVSYSS